MKHLFIGGPVDGQLRETEEQPFVDIIEEPKGWAARLLRNESIEFYHHRYIGHRHCEGEKEFIIYVHSEFRESIMETLINHYKPFTHQPA